METQQFKNTMIYVVSCIHEWDLAFTIFWEKYGYKALLGFSFQLSDSEFNTKP